jgi:transposase InsO family protein
MPWRTSNEEQQRRKFCETALSQKGSFEQLCKSYGIRRQTGHKWLKRLKEEGYKGLKNRTRRPHRLRGAQRQQEWQERLIALKRRHWTWGPKKLRKVLAKLYGSPDVPSVASLGRWLAKQGLTRRQARRKPGPPQLRTRRIAPRRCNDVWAIDFKGQFQTPKDRRPNYPLTVSDLKSRYLIGCDNLLRPDAKSVIRHLKGYFKEYGLPKAIRCDNGGPFGSSGALGLSKITAWITKIGIIVDFIDPGKPQQNGIHERIHRTFKAEAATPPAQSWSAQQRRGRKWQKHYNQERPHESLGQKTPAEVYRKSRRKYQAERPLRYPTADFVRKVRLKGEISFEGRRRYIGEAFSAHKIGLYKIEANRYEVRFANLVLGHLLDTDLGGLRPTVLIAKIAEPKAQTSAMY